MDGPRRWGKSRTSGDGLIDSVAGMGPRPMLWCLKVWTPSLAKLRLTTFAMHLGPLSEVRCAGGGWQMHRSAGALSTTYTRSLRPTLVRPAGDQIAGPKVVLVQQPEADA